MRHLPVMFEDRRRNAGWAMGPPNPRLQPDYRLRDFFFAFAFGRDFERAFAAFFGLARAFTVFVFARALGFALALDFALAFLAVAFGADAADAGRAAVLAAFWWIPK